MSGVIKLFGVITFCLLVAWVMKGQILKNDQQGGLKDKNFAAARTPNRDCRLRCIRQLGNTGAKGWWDTEKGCVCGY